MSCENKLTNLVFKNKENSTKTQFAPFSFPFLFIYLLFIYIKIKNTVERKIVCLEYIPTERQNADIFTKPLDRSKFETLRQVIGVILCP